MTRIIRWLRRHKDAAAVVAIFIAIQGAVLLQGAHTQAVQRQQGQRIERQLCLVVVRQAVRQPPPGNPAANPSRAYLQGEHQTWADMASILGCSR